MHNYTGETIQQYEESGKILILHRDDLVWQIFDVKYEDNLLIAKLDFPMGYHYKYLNPKKDKLNRFKKSIEPEVIYSIHLYTSDTSFSKMDSIISIPVNTIYDIQSYEYARTPSRASIYVSLVTLPLVLLIIITFASAASFGSMSIFPWAKGEKIHLKGIWKLKVQTKFKIKHKLKITLSPAPCTMYHAPRTKHHEPWTQSIIHKLISA